MEGNDIGPFDTASVVLVFEELIASPPELHGLAKQKYKHHLRANDWDRALSMWTPHDMPLRSLSDMCNRLHLTVDLYTFLPLEAGDALDRLLLKKGISVHLFHYTDIDELVHDLRYNRGVHEIIVAKEEWARKIGIRAKTVLNDRPWM